MYYNFSRDQLTKFDCGLLNDFELKATSAKKEFNDLKSKTVPFPAEITALKNATDLVENTISGTSGVANASAIKAMTAGLELIKAQLTEAEGRLLPPYHAKLEEQESERRKAKRDWDIAQVNYENYSEHEPDRRLNARGPVRIPRSAYQDRMEATYKKQKLAFDNTTFLVDKILIEDGEAQARNRDAFKDAVDNDPELADIIMRPRE